MKLAVMLFIGFGLAVSIMIQKSRLNSGLNWPSASLSHNLGVWCSLAIILLFMLFVRKDKVSADPLSFSSGLIIGLTATLSVWFLSSHTAGETMVAMRAAASVAVLLLGLIVLGEKPTTTQWVGFALIILGTILCEKSISKFLGDLLPH